MQQSENEDDNVSNEDQTSYARNEQSTRTFFALLCFFIAVILLGVFITQASDGLTKMVTLLGVVVFAIIGALLFEKRILRSSASLLEQEEQEESDISAENDQDEEVEEDDTNTLTTFEKLVQEALDTIPTEFHKQMENLVVIVEDEPDAETLKSTGTSEGQTLLGLYQGVPLTVQGYNQSMLPERITIYQSTIERYCKHDPDRIREQVRVTVLHEIAHHFGMGHEDMPIWL